MHHCRSFIYQRGVTAANIVRYYVTMIVGEHTIRLITPSRSIEGNVVVFLRLRLRCIYDNKSNVLAIPFLDHWQYA